MEDFLQKGHIENLAMNKFIKISPKESTIFYKPKINSIPQCSYYANAHASENIIPLVSSTVLLISTLILVFIIRERIRSNRQMLLP
jgi:hypothetical protein